MPREQFSLKPTAPKGRPVVSQFSAQIQRARTLRGDGPASSGPDTGGLEGASEPCSPPDQGEWDTPKANHNSKPPVGKLRSYFLTGWWRWPQKGKDLALEMGGLSKMDEVLHHLRNHGGKPCLLVFTEESTYVRWVSEGCCRTSPPCSIHQHLCLKSTCTPLPRGGKTGTRLSTNPLLCKT